MRTVHDVAAYVLELRGSMSAMKLQKLVYYSQAWSLALTGRPLFSEEIQAWAHGPVVYELFDRHRGQFVVTGWPAGDPRRLQPEARSLVEAVAGYYGTLPAETLSAMTHAEAPWKLARAGVPEGSRSGAVITHESMARFYRGQAAPFPVAP
jgi:uncharacterized phage-associated protein